MSVLITNVEKNSPCHGIIKAGERLVAINSNKIKDVLDYMYYCAQTKLDVTVENANGQRTVSINKGEYDELGLEFETYLMDTQQHCSNKCIFCFIDQMPKGMRETLYFKDDDARLSFLMGNYTTLTNLSDEDVERIIKLKISPINISVHATDPQIRVIMMKNPRAAQGYEIMKKFAKAGIEMKGQIVLCPDVNDKQILEKSITDLLQLAPHLTSLSVVPVGLTKFREGLHKLRPVTSSEAKEVIELIDRLGKQSLRKNKSRIVYAADEFFLKAGIDIPSPDYYEGYPQIENGVGMIASMKEEFEAEYKFLDKSDKKRDVTIATGCASFDFISYLVDELRKKWHNLNCKVYKIPNRFFGETINVTGLVTGNDIIEVLSEKGVCGKLLIPAQMLRYDKDKFLDDVLVTDLEKRLKCKVEIVENDGAEFIGSVLGIEL